MDQQISCVLVVFLCLSSYFLFIFINKLHTYLMYLEFMVSHSTLRDMLSERVMLVSHQMAKLGSYRSVMVGPYGGTPLPLTTCHVSELWHKLCHLMWHQYYSKWARASPFKYWNSPYGEDR